MRRYNTDDYRGGHYESDDGEFIKYNEMKELLDLLKIYLNYPSLDGNVKRQELREELKNFL
jgi:hypothetical protein